MGALGSSWPSLYFSTVFCSWLLSCTFHGPACSHCFRLRVFGVGHPPAAFPLVLACLCRGDPIWVCSGGIEISQVCCSTLGALCIVGTVRILDLAAQWLCCAAAEKYRNQIALWGLQADRLAAAIWVEWFHFHVLAKTKMKVSKGGSTCTFTFSRCHYILQPVSSLLSGTVTFAASVPFGHQIYSKIIRGWRERDEETKKRLTRRSSSKLLY